MGKQSKGRCSYCQAEYTKAGMIRHTAACKERMKEMGKAAGGKTVRLFHPFHNRKIRQRLLADYRVQGKCDAAGRGSVFEGYMAGVLRASEARLI